MKIPKIFKGKESTSAVKFINMIANKLTMKELQNLAWEEDGKIYSFQEWMTKKYKNCKLGLSEEELEKEAERIVKKYRN